MERYSEEIESQMQALFSRLSEKDQRHYAGIESMKLGRGGQSYISQLFGISRFRIRMGERELKNPDLYNQIPKGKERRKGGGRKKKKSAIQK